MTGAVYSAMPRASVNILSSDVSGIGEFISHTRIAMASVAWPAANRALYFPFYFEVPVTVTELFTYNGGTASGNIDIGLYDSQKKLLTAIGSTAQAGTSALQFFNITDTPLLPGAYWLGHVHSNTTGTYIAVNAGIGHQADAYGCGREALGSTALPATATFATGGSTYIPFIGMLLKAAAL